MDKARQLQLIQDPACTLCRMSTDASKVCVLGPGAVDSKIMVVGKQPNSKNFQMEMEAYLTEAGLDPSTVYYSSAIKCQNYERDPNKTDIKTCKAYLDSEFEIIKPKFVLVLGNEALLSATGHSGIMKYRGKVIQRAGMTIIPTISPSAVKRNPGQRAGFVADLRFFAAQANGDTLSTRYTPDIKIIDDREKLDKLTKLLKQAKHVVYDIETVGDDEFQDDSRIVSLALTIVYKSPKTGKYRTACVAIPLFHPESPWRRKWRAVLRYLAKFLERVPKHWGHNTKYDARWMRQFGVEMRTDHDSLLMAHVLDENRQKGLKPQAQSRLGVAPWGIDTRNLLTTPLAEVLEYNALDTWYTYHISRIMLKELREKPRQMNIYMNLLIPASEAYVAAERHGVWMDRERLATRTKISYDMRDEVEGRLMQWVPDPGESESWPRMGKKGKPAEINFNASNWARWWLFNHLGMPVLKRGKTKDDGSLGAPSMAEDVIILLRDIHPHPALDTYMERGKWQKYCSSFLDTYETQLDSRDRIHTTYKLHGTVTGRTSSGKVDEEKITAKRSKRPGVNLQQVPRDPFIRGLFGAPPGRAFVEADFSQIELRLAAFIARETEMLHLYSIGADLHRATAARTMGVPESQVSKEQRKKAKGVNFGFLYGMGWSKFIDYAFTTYGVKFTEAEAMAVREAFFQAYPALVRWHARQRMLARKYGRVETPMGRVRHLPDVHSEDKGVRAEAERQAINSPVQGFASDMALLGMIEINAAFKERGIDGVVIGTVHDAVNFDIDRKHLRRALPIIKTTMENLPLTERFGVHLDVPIIADLKVGRHWGDAEEIDEDKVFDWKDEYGIDTRAA